MPRPATAGIALAIALVAARAGAQEEPSDPDLVPAETIPEPPPPPPPPPPVETPPAIEPKKTEPAGPTEVIVRGGKNSPRSGPRDSIGRTEARILPGAFGDPWRAIEIMPGFTPVLSGLPYFYVRGAPPGNVGYYLDGVRVPYLFHFGLGPAVIPPSLIARTDIWSGGYPASLGRWAGGIVDAVTMPPEPRLHGEGSVRAIDAGGILEIPFANGRGTALFGGRYSYTAALFTLLQSDTSLDYRDYQMRVAYQLGERDSVSLFAFGAYDRATQKEFADPASLAAAAGATDPSRFRGGDVERTLFASEFHRVDGRWDHDFAGGGHGRIGATLGFDRTRVDARRAADDLLTGFRASIEQPVTPAFRLRTGLDVTIDQYGGDALPKFADDDDVVERQTHIFAARTDFAAGVYVDTVLSPWSFVEVTPGIRVDAFGSGTQSAVGVDPRIATKILVNDRVRIMHAYGIATQPPSTPILLPGITVANLEGGLQRAVQTSAGVEIDFPYDITTSGSVFHNAFYGLNDALGTAEVELIDIEKSDSLLAKSRGSAYGLELGAKRKVTQRLSGLVTYTLSRSIRSANGREFVSGYDRTHVANLVLSYDLGRNWRAGARYVVYSGVPITPITPQFAGQAVGISPGRTPPFQRLDVRVEKRWNIGAHGWASVVIEALNATLSKEVNGYRCARALVVPDAAVPTPGCTERVIGPISVPSIGVEGGF